MRLPRAARYVALSAVLLVACGSPAPPAATDLPIQTTADLRTPSPEPVPVPTKQPPDATVAFVGWVDGSPAIAARDPHLPATWRVRSLASAGWLDIATLPDGGMPVTDGATVATILDPEGDPDIAL